MKLIDADELDNYIKEKLGDMAEYELFATMIDNQPDAYDIEKVLEQLQRVADLYDSENEKAQWFRFGISIAMIIVEGGGICGIKP